MQMENSTVSAETNQYARHVLIFFNFIQIH